MARATLVRLPKLAYWRVRNGMSQPDLANAAGTTRANVSRIERGGETHPKMGRRLAEALGCTLDELMSEQPR